MKKILIVFRLIPFLIYLLLASPVLFSQNVGIGTNTPIEKLHVSGNINVTGTIKANGVAGQSSQVLTTNGSGNLAWVNMYEFKNVATFVVTGNWTVPANVTKILVEGWGGGGGGCPYSGGGGGAYVRGIFDVVAGNIVSFTVGAGGDAGNPNGQDGLTTSIFFGAQTLTASYGTGASYNSATLLTIPGGGGNYFSSNSNFEGVYGQPGFPNTINFLQSNATTFYEISSGGKGGDAGNSVNTGANGLFRMVNTGTGALIREAWGTSGRRGGGGSGGHFMLFGGGFANGTPGGSGMVTIHY